MGFWKSVGAALSQDAANRQAHTARKAEIKAGKTFHRTGRNLKKADRAARAAESSQDRADRMRADNQRAAEQEAWAKQPVRGDLRPGEPSTRVQLAKDKPKKRGKN